MRTEPAKPILNSGRAYQLQNNPTETIIIFFNAVSKNEDIVTVDNIIKIQYNDIFGQTPITIGCIANKTAKMKPIKAFFESW
jgi:hypothetical protein